MSGEDNNPLAGARQMPGEEDNFLSGLETSSQTTTTENFEGNYDVGDLPTARVLGYKNLQGMRGEDDKEEKTWSRSKEKNTRVGPCAEGRQPVRRAEPRGDGSNQDN